MSTRVILVVEDHQEIRDIVADYISRQGFSVICAANGQEGLDCLEGGQHVDLILLDLNMPVLNGYLFLDQKMQMQAWRDLPVIIFTAESDTDGLQARADVVSIFCKTTPLTELMQRMVAVLDNERAASKCASVSGHLADQSHVLFKSCIKS